MALLSIITCAKCGQRAEAWHSPASPPPKVCHVCVGMESKKQRADALAALVALPIEQRIARIEEWIYDYKPRHVPPPKF